MLDVLDLGDIEIPDIEITPGWLARDVETIEDCDDAFAILTAACAAIEMQIDVEGFKPLQMQRGEWVARAKAALRFKKGALSIITTRRGAGKLVAGALDVTATFLPPDARRRDTDGMFSSIKAYLDGLADATGIDDSKFNLSIRRGDIVRNGLVRLEITEAMR